MSAHRRVRRLQREGAMDTSKNITTRILCACDYVCHRGIPHRRMWRRQSHQPKWRRNCAATLDGLRLGERQYRDRQQRQRHGARECGQRRPRAGRRQQHTRATSGARVVQGLYRCLYARSRTSSPDSRTTARSCVRRTDLSSTRAAVLCRARRRERFASSPRNLRITY